MKSYIFILQALLLGLLCLVIIIISLANHTKSLVLPTSSNIKHAITDGQAYLMQQLKADAYSLTYRTNNGRHPISSKIVASLIIDNIVDSLSPVDKESLTRSINSTRFPIGAWSDDLGKFADADNTIAAWHMLTQLNNSNKTNIAVKSVRSLNKLFYSPHMHAYSTFIPIEASQVPYDSLTPPDASKIAYTPSLENDWQIHPDINAIIYNYLHEIGFDQYINYKILQNAQTKEGYWRSYFYLSKYYASYFVLKLLCETGKLPTQREKGLSFIYSTQNSDGSWGSPPNSYETALAVNTMLVCKKNNSVTQEGIAYLLKQQTRDGYWPSTNKAIWHYAQGQGFIVDATDTNHTLSTALAVKALKTYSRLSSLRGAKRRCNPVK